MSAVRRMLRGSLLLPPTGTGYGEHTERQEGATSGRGRGEGEVGFPAVC